MTNKQSPPTPKTQTLQEMGSALEQRIVSLLANADADSNSIIDLLAEVKVAISMANHESAALRDKSVDITSAPEVAHQAIVDAEAATLARDRLQGVAPKIIERLADVQRSEERQRWLSDYNVVRQTLSDAASLFREYERYSNNMMKMFVLAEHVDKEVSRINGSAPPGEHRRLRRVELEARDLDSFTLDRPSLASTVELRDWNNSGRKLWPSTLSLAEQYAALTTAVPSHPGSRWGEPEFQEQRRAEKEKEHRRMGEHYARMTAEQEDRINAEARENFAASRK
jgi:hypothetical protein